MLRGREYVVPDDIKTLAGPVFAHRIVLDTAAVIDGTTRRDVIENVLADIDVPTIEAS
jgi:MoxR-like ATPase